MDELGGFISTFRDITGQKQAEEALKQARDYLEEKVAGRTKELSLERQRLFDVLETLPVNICLLTTEFDIVFANRAFRERFGEPDGRRCYDYVCGLKEPCEQCQALTPLATGQPHHWMFSGSDGRIIDVHDFPFQDIDGTAMILELNMDITEQRKIETEMARLDRLNLIGEMAASIGHEIRNPMTAVRGFLQMLGDRQGYQYDREFFDIMIEELDRANQIITQYLGMAKNKTINLQLQSLDKIIKALYPMIQSECNLREMGIKLDLCNPTEVWLDENELRQLTLNMCRNAMETMSSHGILTIGTKQEGDEVILYIKDEGSGLSSEITDRIGTPFLTTKENGTGLGLAVCYSIAARHNAGIDYDTGPSGTTFYVRFPKP